MSTWGKWRTGWPADPCFQLSCTRLANRRSACEPQWVKRVKNKAYSYASGTRALLTSFLTVDRAGVNEQRGGDGKNQ